MMSINSWSIPAYPGLMPITTADGETINVRLTGDEYFHQFFTEDGYPLIEKDCNFYYCDYDATGGVIDSGIKASATISKRSAAEKAFISKIDLAGMENRIRIRAEKSPKKLSLAKRGPQGVTIGPGNHPDLGLDDEEPNLTEPPYPMGYGLFPDVHFPAYGKQKAIVILVEYKDVKFNSSYDPHDYFSRMLNQDGFSDYGGTGSAGQYFRESSLGSFTPEFDVYGPITLSKNMSSYGGNDYYGNDRDPGAMVNEACDALDATVDFRDYDRDGDGIVDNIFIFYAGRGEATGGGSDTVWPHSWDMSSAGYKNLYYDGVKIHTYGCSNEWVTYYGGGRPDGVGTFIHEFSHVMGLPDLYATNYSSAFTPSDWSVLDYGPYNNDGKTPPYYGAFERYALGWVKPREIDRAVSATLEPIEENVCGIIRSSKDTEFFLVENRQQRDWDKYIPYHGMLIWHIDYNANVWSQNSVNNTSSHQYVDIEEADGKASQYNMDGDPFPGTSHKTSFTSSTSPAMKTWSNVGLNYPITDIAETAEGLITFNVLGGADTPTTLVPGEPSEVGPEGFTLNWEGLEDGNEVTISIYTLDEEGEPIYFNGYENRNIGSVESITIDNAEAETTYYFTLTQSNDWMTSEPSEAMEVTTGRYDLSYYTVNLLEPTEVERHSFTANWEPLEGATNYLLTLYTKEVIELDLTDDFVKTYVGNYMDLNVGEATSYHITGLTAATSYFYTVRATDGEYFTTNSEEMAVTTNDESLGIGSAETDREFIILDGNVIRSTTGDEIVVADLTGKIIARGKGSLRVSASGLYIVSIPEQGLVRKLIIK